MYHCNCSNKIQRTEETANCGKRPGTREENSKWNPNKISHGKSQRVF